MYPVNVGSSFVVQQSVSGTGRFTGADYGRAKVTLPNGDANAVVRLAAFNYGSSPNGLTVELVDRGAGVAVATTTVEQAGTAIRVLLRRGVSAAPLATANEVANAINQFAQYSRGPIGAVANGNGSGLCVGASPSTISGGMNPLGVSSGSAYASGATYATGDDVTYQGLRFRSLQDANTGHTPDVSPSWWAFMDVNDDLTYRWSPPANTDAGLFHFEHRDTLVLEQFEAKFAVPSGTRTLTISRVPLNRAMEPIAAESVPLLVYQGLTNGAPDFTLNDMNLKLPPRWAFTVTTDVALVGLVRMDVARDAGHPAA